MKELENESLTITKQIQSRTQLCKECTKSNPEIRLTHIEKAFLSLEEVPKDTGCPHDLAVKSI